MKSQRATSLRGMVSYVCVLVCGFACQGENAPAPFTAKHVTRQRVNIDFPLHLLRQIDAECQHAGVTRQAWIKMVCAERLQQRQSAQMSSVESALPAMEGSRPR